MLFVVCNVFRHSNRTAKLTSTIFSEVSRKSSAVEEVKGEPITVTKEQVRELQYNSSKYTKRKKLGINFAARGARSGNDEVEVDGNVPRGEKVEQESAARVTVAAECKDLLQQSGFVWIIFPAQCA